MQTAVITINRKTTALRPSARPSAEQGRTSRRIRRTLAHRGELYGVLALLGASAAYAISALFGLG